MSKSWCLKQNKRCDYLDNIQKCNYEQREGAGYLDCNFLTEKVGNNFVEVIRCKDCALRLNDKGNVRCDIYKNFGSDDFYCALGRLK